MSDQAYEVPLIQLAQKVPTDLRADWPIMWDDEGREIGHSYAPVGKYLHQLCNELVAAR